MSRQLRRSDRLGETDPGVTFLLSWRPAPIASSSSMELELLFAWGFWWSRVEDIVNAREREGRVGRVVGCKG